MILYSAGSTKMVISALQRCCLGARIGSMAGPLRGLFIPSLELMRFPLLSLLPFKLLRPWYVSLSMLPAGLLQLWRLCLLGLPLLELPFCRLPLGLLQPALLPLMNALLGVWSWCLSMKQCPCLHPNQLLQLTGFRLQAQGAVVLPIRSMLLLPP